MTALHPHCKVIFSINNQIICQSNIILSEQSHKEVKFPENGQLWEVIPSTELHVHVSAELKAYRSIPLYLDVWLMFACVYKKLKIEDMKWNYQKLHSGG